MEDFHLNHPSSNKMVSKLWSLWLYRAFGCHPHEPNEFRRDFWDGPNPNLNASLLDFFRIQIVQLQYCIHPKTEMLKKMNQKNINGTKSKSSWLSRVLSSGFRPLKTSRLFPAWDVSVNKVSWAFSSLARPDPETVNDMFLTWVMTYGFNMF